MKITPSALGAVRRRQADERHEIFGDPGIGLAAGQRAQRDRLQAIVGDFGLVARRAVERHADIARNLGLDAADPGLVQRADMGGIDRRLDPLQPVALPLGDGEEAVLLECADERQLGEGRGLGGVAQPDPDQPAGLVHRIALELDPRAEGGRAVVGLGRAFDRLALDVELPGVEDAAQMAVLDPRQRQRSAAMRAALVEEPDPAVGRTQRDIVAAQQRRHERRVARHQLGGEREGKPVVLAHHPAHRRIAFDPGEEFVLLFGQHFALVVKVMAEG